jgi:hypothetical protein
MANNFIFMPYAGAYLPIEPMDCGAIAPVRLGLLGLGSLRTGEKIKCVAK